MKNEPDFAKDFFDGGSKKASYCKLGVGKSIYGITCGKSFKRKKPQGKPDLSINKIKSIRKL